ncbi:hypothetical protein [Edaphobacter albus]|uniref:hypothetical protein n=1 Tax=Edaphobacter sp. 4G125 TaxID=2763071 RepID=UPI001648CAB7|nr:hypothetical protein [Edaphobacter sp. 4G125]QNI36554.1 hypothetical protein H7846_16620 [Edaphobacter sp. 4G125]
MAFRIWFLAIYASLLLIATALMAQDSSDTNRVKTEDLAVGTGTVTVAAGDAINIPVTIYGSSILAKTFRLNCVGLPKEAACQYIPGTTDDEVAAILRISTSAPRDCEAATPYGVPTKSAALPGVGLLLFAVSRKRRWKGLLAVVCAALAISSMAGCSFGNCTDLGTLPGDYIVTVVGNAGGAQVSQKVKLVVTP